MKRHFWLLTLLLLPSFGWGQKKVEDDFERYAREQEAAFSEYVGHEEKNFKAYYDSINREFAQYLAEAWPDYPLKKKEPPIKKPVPPTVYKPDTPRTLPARQPVKHTEKPQPPRVPPVDKSKIPANRPLPKIPVAVPDNSLRLSFYGTQVALAKAACNLPRLAGADEQSVTQLPYIDWTNEIRQLQSSLSLNDWGMYLLINRTFEAKFPGRPDNEQTVFTVFTLNQLGYKAKIGRSHQKLLPLIAFNCNVFNATFFRYGNENGTVYTVYNPGHADLSTIQSCRMEYGGATRLMDMSLTTTPTLDTQVVLQPLKVEEQSYNLSYDKNYMQLLGTYPCVDFRLYAESTPSEAFLQSMEKQLRPLVHNKSQEEAVNALLRFVQYGFKYKTDDEQFGYERWFFPEETVASAYSDCEDRAILFSQLVRRLLNMKVVLVYYPGRHLATAVHFDNPDTTGDYLNVDGKKFLICDPTYFGASLGMGMPTLKQTAVEIIKLKNNPSQRTN